MPVVEVTTTGRVYSPRLASQQAFRVKKLRDEDDEHDGSYAIVGPDGKVWHQSWTESMLVKLATKYNKIFNLGYAAGRTSSLGHITPEG